MHKYCSVLHVHELHQDMGYQLSFKSETIISLIQAKTCKNDFFDMHFEIVSV